MLDFTLAIWGEMFFSEAATKAAHRVFAPISIFSNYRRVRPRGQNILEEFNITTIGLGLGLGYYGDIGERAAIEVRSTPIIGYAVQSFGDSAGLAKLVDTDVQLHVGSVFSRFGISAGYGLRWMVWDLRTSGIFADAVGDLFDYRDLRHTFSLGVNW